MTDNPRTSQPTRRQFLHGAGIAGAAGVVAAGASACANEGGEKDRGANVDKQKDAWPGQGMNEEADAYLADSRVDFDGAHQAGIATPEQAFNKLIAFNLRDGRETVEDARRLLRLWTDDARRMCSGLAGLADLEPENMVATANLTITVGFGRSFLDKLGLEAPDWLEDLPKYSLDELRDEWSGGDLCLQICADDRFTVSHASRFMTKTARSYLDVAWIQDGFLHARGSIEQGDSAQPLRPTRRFR